MESSKIIDCYYKIRSKNADFIYMYDEIAKEYVRLGWSELSEVEKNIVSKLNLADKVNIDALFTIQDQYVNVIEMLEAKEEAIKDRLHKLETLLRVHLLKIDADYLMTSLYHLDCLDKYKQNLGDDLFNYIKGYIQDNAVPVESTRDKLVQKVGDVLSKGILK